VIYFGIPTYNESATIGVLLWKLRKVMEEFPRDYEILVLDDGSDDDTLEVLTPYSRILPLTVIRQDRRGYGAAVERLVRETVQRSTHPKRDVLIVLQADFSEAPEDAPQLIRRIEGGADLVQGSVSADPGETRRAVRWARRGTKLLARRSGAIPAAAEDPVSGFRAYRVALLKRTLAERNGVPLVTTDGWAANVELLAAVAPHSRRTEGVDVVHRGDLRQRPSRFKPWSALVDVWNVTRRIRGSALQEQTDSPSPPNG
jgi:glycosyltransferase involved in cell wall biosynthesis